MHPLSDHSLFRLEQLQAGLGEADWLRSRKAGWARAISPQLTGRCAYNSPMMRQIAYPGYKGTQHVHARLIYDHAGHIGHARGWCSGVRLRCAALVGAVRRYAVRRSRWQLSAVACCCHCRLVCCLLAKGVESCVYAPARRGWRGWTGTSERNREATFDVRAGGDSPEARFSTSSNT